MRWMAILALLALWGCRSHKEAAVQTERHTAESSHAEVAMAATSVAQLDISGIELTWTADSIRADGTAYGVRATATAERATEVRSTECEVASTKDEARSATEETSEHATSATDSRPTLPWWLWLAACAAVALAWLLLRRLKK